jgi:Lamin Tail Domain/PKD domain
MSRIHFILLFWLTFYAPIALAAVTINEVAWMGSTNSANYEWIELYNSGDAAVSLDGWTLKDGMNLNIVLTGSISSNSYAVLERTSEESAAGSAFLLYTGALVNTGATLVLSDQAGSIMDQVTGGTDWENIGGDNTTKETAQYSSTGWVTDVGTPGTLNGAGRKEEVVPEEEEVISNTNTSSGSSHKSSGDTVRLKNPETKMTLKTDVQSTAYVNQTIKFKASASGLPSGASKLIRYEWNFGDSFIATSTTAFHAYRYPGTYVVTVYARSGKSEQVTRHEVTVLPVIFSISRNEVGDVQINNDAPYDIDVSGYIIQGTNSIVLPPRTIIAARGTITIDSSRLEEESESLVALYDTKRTLIASTYESDFIEEIVFDSEETAFVPNPKVLGISNSVTKPSTLSFVGEMAEASPLGEELVLANVATATKPSPISESSEPKWPYLALIGLLLIATVGVIISKNNQTVS